jgi:hypothetical protein
MNEENKEKLREEFEKWANNLTYMVVNTIPLRDLICDFWIYKLDQALTDKVASIRGDLDHLEIYMGFGMPFTMLEKLAVLNLPSLSLPASREENDITK